MARYHESLPEKSEAVTNQWQQIKQRDYDPTLCLELQNMMHKLAGSAGMYGYDALAQKAREVEGLLISGIDTDAEREAAAGQIEKFIVMLDTSFSDGTGHDAG